MLLQGEKSVAENIKASLQHDSNIQSLAKHSPKNNDIYVEAVASMKSSQ